VLHKQKKSEEAKDWLLKAIEDKSAQHIEIFDHLGDVHMAWGNGMPRFALGRTASKPPATIAATRNVRWPSKEADKVKDSK